MAFLRVVSNEAGATVRAERLYLRSPAPGDYQDWAELREASRAFLSPWEPTWPADDLTRTAFRRRLRRYQRDIRDDHCYPFFLFRLADDALLGGLTLSNIRRGVSQSCSLGYWMGAQHAGRGYMSEAVRAVTPFAFGTLRLHRIEAACLPSNARSIALLENAGFQREGLARRFLFIDGRWQDHLLFALLAEDQ